MVAGCGDGQDAADILVVGSEEAAPQSPEPPGPSEPGPSEPSPTTSQAAEPAADKLELCDRVPPIKSALQGSLSQYQNHDSVVRSTVSAYGREHPDTYAGHWLDRSRGGVIMVAFTDDPEPHRAALLARSPSPDDDPDGRASPITDDRPLGERDDVEIDVVQVRFNDATRSATQNRAHDAVAALGIGFDGSGFDMARQRVVLYLVNPPPGAIEELQDRLDDPSAVCVELYLAPDRTAVPEAADVVFEALPGQGLVDPLVVCADWEAVPASQLAFLPGIDDLDHPAVDALRAELAAATATGDRFAEGRWVVIRLDIFRASFAVLSSDGSGSATVAFERDGDHWVRSGQAWERPCGPTVPLAPGFGRVEVNLDPESLPEPDSTLVRLLVTEQGCAGGREMGDALRGPQVRETDDAVLVAFAVVYTPGSNTCPGNPPTSVTIELSEPLGERMVLDGLYWPPQRVEVADLDW